MGDILNIDAIHSAPLENSPYPHIIASQFIRPEAMRDLERDFPDIRVAGFHHEENIELKGSFLQLIQELRSSLLIDALSTKFYRDFSPFPSLISVRKFSAAHEGRIHRDSNSKVMSLLLYLNREWQYADGQLRVLYNANNIHSYKAELSPRTGTVFAFLRTDNSWHGHTPFVGERRVVQVAWLHSQQELERKKKRHQFSGFLKRIFS